jgi:hypothetical protein
VAEQVSDAVTQEVSEQVADAADEAEEAAESFTGLNFFGDQSEFVFAFDGYGVCLTDDYVPYGYGGVIRTGIYDHHFDADDSYISDSTAYTIYYSASAGCIVAAGTLMDGLTYDQWRVFSGIVSYNDLATDTALTFHDSVGSIGDSYSGTFESGGKYYNADRQWINKGSGKYLKLSTTGTSLDNFMTNTGGDWAFGFTLKEDWNVGAGALQMFVDASSTTQEGNFGLALVNDSMMSMSYLAHSSGGTMDDENLDLHDTDDFPKEGDSVILQYDSTNDLIYFYINGQSFGEVDSSILPSSALSGREFTWGKAKTDADTGVGESNYNERMPVSWSLKIKDLWIANNDLVDASEVAIIASSIVTNDDLSTYTNYSTAITHHWALTDNLDATKGGLNFSLESE